VADLNYDNREMRAAMIDAMRYWVDSVGIDGYRCDVADAVPADFWQEAIAQLRDAASPRELLMLAEGKHPDTFAAGFDMNYAWDFMAALEQVFVNDSSVSLLLTTDSLEYAGLPQGKVKLRFTTNHDESTKATPVAMYGGEQASMAAFVAATMLHGGMLVYGSQEVGYPTPINFFHYVPVNWDANPAMRDEYKRLIALYNAHPALQASGSVTSHDDPAGDVLMVERQLQDDRVLVVVNTRAHDSHVTLPAGWQSPREPSGRELTLAPHEYLLLTPDGQP